LIDSNANEAASHGFLMFKISQKETNQTNDLIQNEAAIYFDYNQPVITNKAFNIIGLPKQMKEIVGITAVEETFNAKVFYDNVYLNILLPLSAAQEQYSFTLYDILGRDIKHETRLSLPKHDLLVGHLTAGVYVFEIEAASGEKASSKLIVP